MPRLVNGLDARRERATRIFALVLAGLFACSGGLPLGSAEADARAVRSSQSSSVEKDGSGAAILTANKPQAGTISGGQAIVYQFRLSPGQHLAVTIDYKDIDLVARLTLAEAGMALNDESQSRGADGQKKIDVVADAPATYQLHIETRYPKAAPGHYQVQIGELRAATKNDRLLYEAAQSYFAALRLYRQGAYGPARESGEHARQLREQALGPEHPDVAAALALLGRIADARNDYAAALPLHQRALGIVEKSFGPDSLAAAEVLDGAARSYTAVARLADAEQAASRAMEIREHKLGANDFLLALSLETLSDLYVEKVDYVAAERAANRALEIAGRWYGADDLAYADAEGVAGRAAARRANYARAEELLAHASKTKQALAGESSLVFADSLADLGMLALLRFDNVHALEIETRALALEEAILGPNHLKIGIFAHNLALLNYRRRDFTRAEGLYQRALAIKERVLGTDHPQVGVTVNNMGLLYWRLQDYPKATAYFLRAVSMFEKQYGPDSLYVAQPLANLGIMAKETGDYKRAEEYYLRAIAIEEKAVGDSPALEVTVESLAILYRDQGDYARAEPIFLRALQITEKTLGAEHPIAARTLQNLAQLNAATGNVVRAREFWQRASAIEEKNLPLSLATGSERQNLAYFDTFMINAERIISFQFHEAAADVATRDLAATTLLQRKGRVLDALAGNFESLRNRSTPEDRALLDQLKNVTSKLANLVLNGPGKSSLAEQQQQIKSLSEQRDSLEIEIGRRSAGYYQSPAAVTLRAIRDAVPPEAALVEYAIYQPYDPRRPIESINKAEPRYVAYVITHSGAVQARDLGETREIDLAVGALRRSLRDPEARDVKRLARALDEKVMRPVREMTGDARHLLIAPDGQLDLIPFEALADEAGHYLVERYLITYLTTGRDLLSMQPHRSSKTDVTVVADPYFDDADKQPGAGVTPARTRLSASQTTRRNLPFAQDLSGVYFAPLGGTKIEADAIRALFPKASVLTGIQATKAALLKLEAPSILHIATHGFFLEDQTSNNGKAGAADGTRAAPGSDDAENPLLRSGLALSGANVNQRGRERGILTALEAANLNLWGTKLVTLSACDTGIGEVRVGEGVYGLRRAFVLSGAESLVMSLWPVSDFATREMIRRYYTGLKNGRGRGEALRQAQLAMLKRKGREHPFYWASFIESGEWANLDGQR